MAKTKVVNIISDIDRWVSFEWITERLDSSQFDLVFVLLNSDDSFFERFLRERKVPVYRIRYRNKLDGPLAVLKLWRILMKERPQITHSHFLPGGLVGLTASLLAGVKQRFYTRRHGSMHHDEAIKKGLFYDYYMNAIATKIVATGETVRDILIHMDHAKKEKVNLIHHGFQISQFENVEPARIEALRKKYGIEKNTPVIGVISRCIVWKGLQYTIPAYKRLLKEYPNAVMLMANYLGDYKPQIDALLAELPESSYRKIHAEKDIFAFYHLFDFFIHVPTSEMVEAFGQIYIESLASRVPSIFTRSGVAREFVKHERNALVVDYENSDQIYHAMKRILSEPELVQKLKENGYHDVYERYSFDVMVKKISQLYSGHSLN